MATDSNAAGDWVAAVQKAQADMLRQWSQLGQAALGAAGAAPRPRAAATAGTPEGLARQFMQQCEQYLGVSQIALGTPDPVGRDRRSRAARPPFHGWRRRAAAAVRGPVGQSLGRPPCAGEPGVAWRRRQLAGRMRWWRGRPGPSGMGGVAWPGRLARACRPSACPRSVRRANSRKSWQRIGQLVHALLPGADAGQRPVERHHRRSLRELAERLAPRLKSGAAPGLDEGSLRPVGRCGGERVRRRRRAPAPSCRRRRN